jgi:hypothetical protein
MCNKLGSELRNFVEKKNSLGIGVDKTAVAAMLDRFVGCHSA